ncbi:hypothetical protein KSP40_PGU002154 [Platanthera guangdongensis]|uniref:Uncharacterized protein n=1 Tax=Platanthera guangdongensis TaxID=2320717 RepID=A0ABR2MAU0_9ASPA
MGASVRRSKMTGYPPNQCQSVEMLTSVAWRLQSRRSRDGKDTGTRAWEEETKGCGRLADTGTRARRKKRRGAGLVLCFGLKIGKGRYGYLTNTKVKLILVTTDLDVRDVDVRNLIHVVKSIRRISFVTSLSVLCISSDISGISTDINVSWTK